MPSWALAIGLFLGLRGGSRVGPGLEDHALWHAEVQVGLFSHAERDRWQEAQRSGSHK